MQNATVEAILQNTFLHGSGVDGIWQVGQMLGGFVSDPHQAVDDSSFSSDPFLPGSPKDLLESGQFNTEVGRMILIWCSLKLKYYKVEVILGTTKDEGILWVIEPIKNNTLFEKMKMEWDTGIQIK